MVRGGRGRNDRGGRNAHNGRNVRDHQGSMDHDNNQGWNNNRDNNQNNRNYQNQTPQNNDNRNRRGRNNRNNQSNENWNSTNSRFNNSNRPNNNHNHNHNHNSPHHHNHIHHNHNRGHRPRHGNNRQNRNGYTDDFNQPNGVGQYIWVPGEVADDQMSEAQYVFNEEGGPMILTAPSSPVGMGPKPPADVMMLDAPPLEVKTSWRRRNDEMLSMLYEKRPPGLNGDLTVIRHALDNMDKDFSDFLRASLREDSSGDELSVNLQVLQLHLALWTHFFESDSAEIYALQNGFNPNCLGQENFQQVPMIVSWFASDPTHSQQAHRGFVLLWSKSGAKRSRQLGLATVCQLFIQSLSRPELHVPIYHEPSSPVFSPLSLFERPIRTIQDL